MKSAQAMTPEEQKIFKRGMTHGLAFADLLKSCKDSNDKMTDAQILTIYKDLILDREENDAYDPDIRMMINNCVDQAKMLLAFMAGDLVVGGKVRKKI